MMGGKVAHEYMYLTPSGEDTLLFCDHCGYSANRQIARFARPAQAQEELLPLKKVATPHTSTIEDLAGLLEIPTARTAKAVFMVATLMNDNETSERFIFCVVRGDMDLNEFKLANSLGTAGYGAVKDLRPATEAEISAVGAVPGYASPIGLPPVGDPNTAKSLSRLVIVDELIPASFNLVAGANEEGYHMLNTNYERDYQADLVVDIAAAADGSGCPECGQAMAARRGVEVGNIFQLGTRYSDAMGCTFLDDKGQAQPVIMGSYGIGLGRLMACIAEQHHDDHGLCWPASVAPYPTHLVSLGGQGTPAGETANQVYANLKNAGMEPLFDDRSESAGVKFMDADLIGLPVRLTVSERSLKQGGVEVKRREETSRVVVAIEDVAVIVGKES